MRNAGDSYPSGMGEEEVQEKQVFCVIKAFSTRTGRLWLSGESGPLRFDRTVERVNATVWDGTGKGTWWHAYIACRVYAGTRSAL
ncbi:Uncharacterized protein TCM_045518 [Theobroma cacao]|uniref:Uncharacterized protein n=1 Tax=Theobroma cacao TaxID=3641 RepID=A0A061FS29_THECC|nr:Uncharacterized protein TCM_045518 [Theobroma cacao]